MKTFLEKGQTIDLYFNSPFLSGVGFNSHYLLVNGYKYFREKIARDLGAVATGDWTGSPHKLQRGDPVVPHFIVSRLLEGDVMSDSLQANNIHPVTEITLDEDGKSPDAAYAFESVEIRFSDFGYGYLVVTGALHAKRDMTGESLRAAGEKVAAEIVKFSGLIRSTCFLIMNAIPEPITAQYTLAGTSNKYGTRADDKQKIHIGELANQPRIFTMRCATTQEFEEKKKQSRDLLISQSEDYAPDSALQDGYVIHVGSGSSVLICNGETVSKEDALTLLRTHQVMNFFYHIIEDYTSDLFFHNNRLNLMSSSLNVDDIEEEMRLLIEYKSQITFFMAVYNDYDNHIGPQELRIWRDIETRWEAADRLKALKDQLAVSQSIYDWLNNDLANIRGKSITSFVMIFTVLSMLSVVVDTVDFTQGGELQLPSVLRVGVLGMMAILILLFAKAYAGRRTTRMKIFSRAAKKKGRLPETAPPEI